MKHNNAISTGRKRKGALKHKTWFSQPIQRKLRKEVRREKAKVISPMNTEVLRPVVMCNSRRYNMKERLGRGFSFAEIKVAGLTADDARKMGIAVDPRRHSYSEEGLQRNVSRIQEYLSKCTVYKTKGEGKAAGAVQHRGIILPPKKTLPTIEAIPISQVNSQITVCNQINKLRNECIYNRTYKDRVGLLREFPVSSE
ncbi:large subunit ribosomal protein L13e [Nematocida sp. LUAm3]|nr:large subunit ribosomal protein L13e [Nematocida sp. LUAm3]KAI5173889.1 large subunit ribosomal protein L13e [Nematocida sp. LUAm2]KAI5177366.1 large subunit ribosomal protein L13e [Nematocida sp. LUAm1]